MIDETKKTLEALEILGIDKRLRDIEEKPTGHLGRSSSDGSSISDEAYGASWNEVTTVGASKNAIYDKIETLAGGQIVFNLIGTADEQAWVRVPYDCTITGWFLTADVSGSIVADLWVGTYANFPPTNADTITGGNKPELSSAQKATDATLTGWVKTLTAGDYILANVDSASTLAKASLILTIERT